MRRAALIPLFLASLVSSCKPTQEPSPEIDLLSQEWRDSQSESLIRQAAEMHEQALEILDMRDRNGEYSHRIRSQFNFLRSNEPRHPVLAMSRLGRLQSTEVIPQEVLVGLVVPLLSNPRGYMHFSPSTTSSLSISESAATLLGSQVGSDHSLIVPLAAFVLSNPPPACRTLEIVLESLADAQPDSHHLETVALALTEIALREAWAEERPTWKIYNAYEEPPVCDLRRESKLWLRELQRQHPDAEYLEQVVEPANS